ncbi:MAG: amino acid adenylation domain-containing protein [Gemmatimonadetes bacterium]|nr:amino acid adenylation domain-containing protein [Gemmatimonadota bacterium]
MNTPSLDRLSPAKRALLEAMLREQGVAAPAATAIPPHGEGPAPLSFAQQRLWFVDRLNPGLATYNIPVALRLEGPLDEGALARAVDEVVRRHDVLRAVVQVHDGEPVQVVRPFQAPALRVETVPGDTAQEREAELERMVAAETAAPFDLQAGPLYRARLLRLSAEDHAFFFTAHHAASDGWSSGVLLRELSALYAAFARGEPSPLPALPIQYADFAAWQRRQLGGATLEAQTAWWRERLKGAPALLELPTDRPRPAEQSFRGARVRTRYSREVQERVRALAQREGVSTYMVLLAAFDALLARYSGQTDLLVGSPSAGRTQKETEPLIGVFANTLVLRTDLSGDPTFVELLARVRETTLSAFAHQDVPFEKLVEELRPERTRSHSPIFQVLFAFQNAFGEVPPFPGVSARAVKGARISANFDLAVAMAEGAEGLAAWVDYAEDLWDAPTAERMLEHLGVLLDAATAHPERRLSALPILTAEERAAALAAAAGPAAEHPRVAVHRLVEAQAARTPDGDAVVIGDTAVTFAELNARANRVARRLRALGVDVDVRVGTCFERSAEAVVAMLAVLKAGGAYVPLDPAVPAERRGRVIADAGIRLVLTGAEGVEALPDGVREIRVGADPFADEDGADLEVEVPPSALAYVIYTSGSTGTPKGVMVPHAGVAGMALAYGPTHRLEPRHRLLALPPLTFDAFGGSLYPALVTGAALVLHPDPAQLTGRGLVEFCERHGVTVVDAPAALLKQLIDDLEPLGDGGVPGPLEAVMTGGEAVDMERIRRWARMTGGRVQVISHYGPTEATVTATVQLAYGDTAPRGEPANLPLGRPIANVRVYVLDAHGRPQPVGVPGEMFIGGAGVTRGYQNRPAQTAEAFVPDPFAAEPGARMYRTGDRARFRPDGTLEFMGRLDFQVKVRGFRVEPGEIEAALAALPEVREAVVVVRDDAAGERRLVAYVVPADPAAAPTPAQLRDEMRRVLPSYMVPAAFVVLQSLPLTAHRKVDRRALPAPDAGAGAAWEAPRTPTGEVVAGVWGELLGVARVGWTDDFFALGGHSLLATRVVSRMRELFGVELPLRTLFEGPSLAEVAGAVDALRLEGVLPPAPPIFPVPRDGELPLSFAQERLWFIDQLQPGESAYNIPVAWRLVGALDLPALERALAEVVRRHEVLRSVLRQGEQGPVQVVLPAGPVPVPVEDCSALPAEGREDEARRRARAETEAPFDLAAGPLFRARLLRLGEREHVLLVTMHHAVSDGWSMGVLFREMAALYGAFARGEDSPLAELPVQYADFAAWQRRWLDGDVRAAQLAYWQARLAGAPAVLELPTDRPRPAVQSLRGAQELDVLPAALLDALRALARREGSTLYMVLLAAFNVLLSRWSGQDDLVVGTPIAGRNRRETEGLIGLFLNTLALRGDLSGNPPFRALLARVRETTLGAYAHQDLPFEALVEALQPERSLGHTPLYQALFALQNLGVGRLELPGVQVSGMGLGTTSSKNDLSLYASEAPEGLHCSLIYNPDLFDAATMGRMLGHFRVLLESVAADPSRPVAELEMLAEDERARVLREWNRTDAAWPSAATVHGVIAEQAARTPDAPAVVFRGTSLTYAELDARASRLAHHLRALGAGPEARVGICLERSAETVVAILAVLKAGAAYLPLDPAYPAERLAYMLEDSGARLLVTQESLRALLPAAGAAVVSVNGDAERIAARPAEAPADGADPRNAAYVIYTSGSTGQPKGVQVTHGNAVSFFAGMDERVGGPVPGTWLAVTRTSFDIHVLELLWTLARGFKVVVQPELAGADAPGRRARRSTRPMAFSLFYFSSGGEAGAGDKYRLLLEGAKFADRNGFDAVWTPERHFHAFGGVFPNPAVVGAAVAAVTERVAIRAGSVVLPLHDPLRVAEEWSVVDNLSHGRVGVSFASGWQPNDFVLAPGGYADRREQMFRDVETVRALWRGEPVTRTNGVGKEIPVRVLPRPVQPELPVWVTAGGSPETFRRAGQAGARLLTHLLGQTVEELTEKVAAYRQAYRESGAPGQAHVTLMLHTFVGDDLEAVRRTVREPFRQYLASAADLIRPLAQERGVDLAAGPASQDDMDAILDHAFERYWQSAALMGTPESCGGTAERLKEAGVDEIACLIDFIDDADVVLDALPRLDAVRREANRAADEGADEDESIAAQIRRHGVTHLQCTPSLAGMTIAESGIESLAPLDRLLLGGEALPGELAAQIRTVLPDGLVNVYGPTETTVWSATHAVADERGTVPIGAPIANTRTYVLDGGLRPLPAGVPGELFIAGAGVTRGYHGRAGMTAERFVPEPFGGRPGARMYRTGDRARWRADGTLEYLGRADFQVKVRGFRIEPGEIESLLRAHPAVADAVVVARHDALDGARLVAYTVPAPGAAAETAELRAHLAARLPDYMVPGAFVSLDAFPLTPNGKLDRRALPEPQAAAPTDRYVAPSTTVEEVLAEIWAEVLNVERVGVRDDFFQLGGHSLRATRVLTRLRQTFQAEVPLRAFFQAPTIAALAEHIGRDPETVQRIEQITEVLRMLSEADDEQVSEMLARAGADEEAR